MLSVLDLFSGIGGFSLGLERTGGFRTAAFCENDATGYAQAVLSRHWPDVPIYPDIRELGAAQLAADGIRPDVLCGGFPCVDISNAGRRAGIEGESSGLWREYARLVGELRPRLRYVIVENVAALLARGLERVLGDLAALGFDAEWHCIPASALGAPHERDRVWIVAYPDDRLRERPPGSLQAGRDATGGGGEALADAERPRQPGPGESFIARYCAAHGEGQADDDAVDGRLGSVWSSEPRVDRVANGVPYRTHRLRCLGNAVVPQIPELIGRAILMREGLLCEDCGAALVEMRTNAWVCSENDAH